MKKTFLAVALFLFAFGSAAMAQRQAVPQQLLNNMQKQLRGEKWAEFYRPSTIIVQSYEDATRYSYEYDEDYLLTRMQEDTKGTNTAWMPYSEYLYEYDYNGNVIEILIRDLELDEDYQRETMTYSGGKLMVDLYQEWDGSNWNNLSKAEYNYYTDEILMVIIWNWNGTTWTSDYMYTYTTSGNTYEMLVQYMQGGAWQNEERVTTTYNEDGTKDAVLTEFFETNAWEEAYKDIYHYTNGHFDEIMEYFWINGAWTDNGKSTYVYDAHGNSVSGERFCYDGGWNPCYGDLEVSFDKNNMEYSFSGLSFEATYIDLTGIGEEPESGSFTFYPNPVKDVLTIMADDFQKAEVYSLTGAKLSETTSNRVDVSGLQVGMYLLKVYGMETGCKARAFVVR